ncbi:uncharacterized protein LOC135952203 [Calliphora vicina]|uniref:uncharacterized protein LOC135952203 n=1 Tax=Calliphora vicina TaxID=7373 RepID=UPI00325B3916
MKLSIFFLIAVPVLICTKSVQAGYNYIGSYEYPETQHHKHSTQKHHHRHTYDDPETYNALNRNSIYRNGDHVVVHSQRSHKVYNDIEKDTTSVIVKDDNGNVQQSTQVYISSRRD